MNKLYVRFAGDNDYRTTVKAFVESIAPRILLEDGEWKDITKEQIVELFNNHAYSLYALHQSHTIKTYHSTLMKNYLKIDIEDVYFDEEFNEFTNYNSDGCLAVLEHDKIGYYIW